MKTPTPPDFIPEKKRRQWRAIWRDARTFWADKETESESFYLACEVIAPEKTREKLGPKEHFRLPETHSVE
ncbi:hypothetical protein [Martelella radicis]|uniref:Uncharacterized protein n=1 Tax=Martelella radicis TaxID=1397476 RepID=A0A7W6KFC7_9HYPH|nr:hypothetical protein [Martelella radicis]MBB4120213.1 hypothetical protein [Martelella radicis]